MPSGPGHDEQRQGRVGERELERLADEAHLVPIQPRPDAGGWDYCVQENDPAPGTAIDLRSPGRRWMVQVKTVRRLTSTVKISLSNWERMAKDPLPWFVLVVEVVDLRPRRSFLVHIGAHWIGRTLETLTKLSPAAQTRLNTRTMGLKWGPDDELSPPDGATYLSMLLKHAGDSPAAYAARKQRLVENVGYDGPCYRGTMRVGVEGLDQLAEFAVGLRDSLPVQDVIIDRVRFGRPTREAELLAGALTVQARPVSGQARITLTRASTKTRCSLEFNLTQATRVLPGLPRQHERFALLHPLVQLYVGPSGEDVEIRCQLVRTNEAVSLSVIGPAADFVTTIGEAGSAEGVVAELQVNAGPVSKFQISVEDQHARELTTYVTPFADAWAVARRVGLEQVRVVPGEVVAQRDRLFVARTVLADHAPGAARLKDLSTDQLREGLSAVLGSLSIRFGETVCAFGVSCVGAAKVESGPDARPELVIRSGTYMTHGLRLLSRDQYTSECDTLQRAIDACALAELPALRVTNVFIPRRDGRGDRLLFHPGPMP